MEKKTLDTADEQTGKAEPLLPYPKGCVVGSFIKRVKRFSVEMEYKGESVWIHSNNSGSMMGLLRKGAPVLASPAANPNRKLKWTQEAVGMGNLPGKNQGCLTDCASWAGSPNSPKFPDSSDNSDGSGAAASDFLWVGVNTMTPNRMLKAAFEAGKLEWAEGYTDFKSEAKYGDSRLDGRFDAEGKPSLWVECKNVTMVEDDIACFPDAATERGQKHLREMIGLVEKGHRAAFFYLIQRSDGECFGPADFVDPAYAELFWQAIDAGVEVYPHRGIVTEHGIDLGPLLPLASRCKG